MNNPSAAFVSTGCLNHYRLAFTLTSSRWQGAAHSPAAVCGHSCTHWPQLSVCGRSCLYATAAGSRRLNPGAAADILEDRESRVWGTVWRVDAEHADSLDRQACPSSLGCHELIRRKGYVQRTDKMSATTAESQSRQLHIHSHSSSPAWLLGSYSCRRNPRMSVLSGLYSKQLQLVTIESVVLQW